MTTLMLAAFFETVYALRWLIVFSGVIITTVSLVVYQAEKIRQLKAELARRDELGAYVRALENLARIRPDFNTKRGTDPSFSVFDETQHWTPDHMPVVTRLTLGGSDR